MTGWPVPSNYPITTAYGKRGSYWSCNEDSNGNGVHTGADFACPSNTPLYATIAGEVRHRNYGSAFGDRQFAISPDPGQPFAEGEVFYAHCNERLADGTRVEVGDYVGKSGARGNVSGPHLHYEFHPSTKNAWNCSVHADPAPTLTTDGGPYVTGKVYRSKCGYGEPTNGDSDSDTVKELQHRLNHIPLTGGEPLPITGKYDVETDDEVRKWQDQICHDTPDPELKSYLGPNQFAAMFPDSIYELVDDGDPAIANDTEPPDGGTSPPETVSSTTLGQYLKAQGFTVHDEDVPLGRDAEWHKVEWILVHHTGGSSDDDKDPENLATYIRTAEGPNLYPPLAQIFLDKDGEVWMCSAQREGQAEPGRASQAGEGEGYGVPDDTMNAYSLGIECQCDGTHPLAHHAVLYEVLIELLGALCERFGLVSENVIGHKEWSTTGKTDPLDDMDLIRADVADNIGETEPPDVEEPPEEGDLPDIVVFVWVLHLEYVYEAARTVERIGSKVAGWLREVSKA